MPLRFDGREMMAYEDYERHHLSRRGFLVVAALVAAVVADQFLGLGDTVRHLIAPLMSI